MLTVHGACTCYVTIRVHVERWLERSIAVKKVRLFFVCFIRYLHLASNHSIKLSNPSTIRLSSWEQIMTWIYTSINSGKRSLNSNVPFRLHLEAFVCLVFFICLEFFFPLENFSHIWRRHHYRWKAANFDLYLALMAIEQWGFFSVPQLLWQGTSVYDPRGPEPLTLNAERLTVELSLPVFTT